MKKQNILNKAVVLAIVVVFIGGAFVPAVGSQVENGIVDIQDPSDDERSVVSDESLLDRITYGIHRLIDILGNNPIVNRLRESFTGKYVDSNTNPMDKLMIPGGILTGVIENRLILVILRLMLIL